MHACTLCLNIKRSYTHARERTSHEPVGKEKPAFARDTTNVYLVTSRDGVHIDDSWVYAQRPLLRKGPLQSSWDGGFFLPAAQIVSDEQSHRVYFEVHINVV